MVKKKCTGEMVSVDVIRNDGTLNWLFGQPECSYVLSALCIVVKFCSA